MTNEEKDRMVQADIERLLGDLTERAYVGQLRGIAVATLDEAGFRCQFSHYDKKRGELLAATCLLQQDIIRSFEMREAMPVDTSGPPPQRPDDPLGQRVVGVGRVLGESRAVEVSLGHDVSDDDIRALHDYLHGWKP
jgi:hypothetical protein